MFRKIALFSCINLCISLIIGLNYPQILKHSVSISVEGLSFALTDNYDESIVEAISKTPNFQGVPSSHFSVENLDRDRLNGIGNCSQVVSSFASTLVVGDSDAYVLHFLPIDGASRGLGHSVLYIDGVIYDVFDRLVHRKSSSVWLAPNPLRYSTYLTVMSNRDAYSLGLVSVADILDFLSQEYLATVDAGNYFSKVAFHVFSVYTFQQPEMKVDKLPFQGMLMLVFYFTKINIYLFWFGYLYFILQGLLAYVRNCRSIRKLS